MAGSLLLMPRLYGQAHLIDTDTPGLLLWAATALAFWKGLHEPGARRWRVLVGVLMGLAFVEKMGAVMVLLPLLGWLAATRLVPAVLKPSRIRLDRWPASRLERMLAPLALAFQQIQIIQRQLPPPQSRESVRPDPERLAGGHPGDPAGGLADPAGARPALPRKQGLGGRAARAGDLDGDPGLRPGRRLAGEPRLVARDAPPPDALLHAHRRAGRGASSHPDHATSDKSISSASPGTMRSS